MTYFDSADTLPIWNYWMITSTGKLDYLLKSGELSKLKPQRDKQIRELAKVWDVIQEEMNEVFVKDPDFVNGLIEEKDYIYKRIDHAVSQSPLTKIKLDAAEKEREQKPDFDYDQSIAVLEKYLGFSVNDKEMSVKRYYTHLRLMKEQNRPKD